MKVPTIDQIDTAICAMPSKRFFERRDRLMFTLLALIAARAGALVTLRTP
jgi:hypothetical protein